MLFPILSQLTFWNSHRLPVLLQTEGAECGLACMAMVASYWGHRTDIPSTRRRFSVSMKGMNLKGMMAMANGLSLQTRALKLDLQHLPELKLPCVLHWDLNHFVVLKSVSAKRVVVHDPAVGERHMPIHEFAKHFTGIALELTPTAQFTPKEERQQFSLVSLMGHVIGLRRGLFQLLALGLALGMTGFALAGRRSVRTRYRPDPWGWPEWGVTACAVTTGATLVTMSVMAIPGLISPVDPIGWPAVPALAVAGILVSVLPAFIAPPAPGRTA